MVLLTIDGLFETLDRDSDGQLSRADLRSGAEHLGWSWPEAPLYAVLDRLTLEAPLSLTAFRASLETMRRDPHGPYGTILLEAPPPATTPDPIGGGAGVEPGIPEADLPALLSRLGGPEVGADLAALCAELQPLHLRASCAALLLIDPQRSFTQGAWMQSIGPTAAQEVAPLAYAFAACGRFLALRPSRLQLMVTRCPFPPESYDWDESVAWILGEEQRYLVKPGNSVLWPATNGFAVWVDRLLESGRTHLILGGCTLNSCVRVSAVQVQQLLGTRGLQVVVHLGLCGARLGNYRRSQEFAGRSSVEAAVREMISSGVLVVPEVLLAEA